MLRVGLTGGIASGKSTVVAMLRELGCAVLEADPLAHEAMERDGPAYADVIEKFGREICAPDGSIDRRKLGAMVFADADRREQLNRIVHPHVIRKQQAQLAEWERGGRAVGVIEAPLLIEAGYHTQLDRLAVCWCTPEQQLARLKARGLSEEQARQRIGAQMPIDEKRRLADDEIDCSGTVDETRAQVARLWAQWKQIAAQRSRR